MKPGLSKLKKALKTRAKRGGFHVELKLLIGALPEGLPQGWRGGVHGGDGGGGADFDFAQQ